MRAQITGATVRVMELVGAQTEMSAAVEGVEVGVYHSVPGKKQSEQVRKLIFLYLFSF